MQVYFCNVHMRFGVYVRACLPACVSARVYAQGESGVLVRAVAWQGPQQHGLPELPMLLPVLVACMILQQAPCCYLGWPSVKLCQCV